MPLWVVRSALIDSDFISFHFSQIMKFLSNRAVRPFSGYNHLMSLLICRRFAKIPSIVDGVKIELQSAHGISTRKPCDIAFQLDPHPFCVGFSRDRRYSSCFCLCLTCEAYHYSGVFVQIWDRKDNFIGL